MPVATRTSAVSTAPLVRTVVWPHRSTSRPSSGAASAPEIAYAAADCTRYGKGPGQPLGMDQQRNAEHCHGKARQDRASQQRPRACAETIGVRSCLLAIARNVGGKRLVEESQFGAGSVGRFS